MAAEERDIIRSGLWQPSVLPTKAAELRSSTLLALHSAAEFLSNFLSAERLVIELKSEILPDLPPVEWASSELSAVEEELLLQRLQSLRSALLSAPQNGVYSQQEEELSFPGFALCANFASAVFPLHLRIILFAAPAQDFRDDDSRLLSDLSQYVLTNIEALWKLSKAQEAEPVYRRLVETSRQLFFNVSSEGTFNYASRSALDFFGASPEELRSKAEYPWFSFVAKPEEQQRVLGEFIRGVKANNSFEINSSLHNSQTGKIRRLLLKFKPVKNLLGETVSWDVSGEDLSEANRLEQELELEQRKVHFLYSLSSLVSGPVDIEYLLERGLAGLLKVSDSSAALVCTWEDGRLELLGHTSEFDSWARKLELEKSSLSEQEEQLFELLTAVAKNREQVLIADVRKDARVFASGVVRRGEFLSLCAVPIVADAEVFGVLAVFSKKSEHYAGEDVLLLEAAAGEFAVVRRQLSVVQAYKQQTKALSALYRLNRELLNVRDLGAMLQQAFSIIQEELGLKRLWLGFLNDRGDTLVGQAAYGTAWRRALVEMQLPISGSSNPLQQVIAEKKPLLVENSTEIMDVLGLKRVFSRFGLASLIFVPLITKGQVLGVLAVQPQRADSQLREDEIALLSSLANEIGSIILTKKLERRLAEGERMRSSALLAAGIAHNFNNLLQAILGQASLLEMQLPAEPAAIKASKIIVEAATRGAALVKQLVSFANLEEARALPTDLQKFIEASSAELNELLGAKQQLVFSLKNGLPLAFVDPSHLSRILHALLKNASESMGDKGGPIQIFTDFVDTEADASHVEVPAGQYVRIGVRDSGKGMDAETRRRCFEPFFTTKDVDPSTGLGLNGAGLGLAQAYALAKKNAGRLTVDSRPALGSVFMLYLPIYTPGKKREEGVEPEAAQTEVIAHE